MPVSAAPPRREDPSRIALEYARRFGAPPRSVLEALYALDQAHRAPEVFAALKEPSVHDLHGMARCLIDLKRPREAHTLLETHWDGVTPDAGLALLPFRRRRERSGATPGAAQPSGSLYGGERTAPSAVLGKVAFIVRHDRIDVDAAGATQKREADTTG